MYSLQGSLDAALVGQAIDLATKANLQHCRDIYFDCLLACTGLVGLGLLMEVLEIKHDLLEAIGRKSRKRKYWLALPIDRREYPEASPCAKVLATVGWVLIVVGVAGEGVFEGFVSKYDTALSKVTDAIVAEAQKESKHAEATAKGFDARIAESDARAKSAEATAKQFEAQIAGAQQDAAESKKEAEKEHLERVKLQAQLVWRRVSPDQCAIIRKALGTFSNTGINIEYVFGDTEGAQYAADLRACLGLLNGNSTNASPGMVWPEGLWIRVKDRHNPLAMRLQSALRSAKIEVGEDNANSFDVVLLFVGPKPRPKFTTEDNTQ